MTVAIVASPTRTNLLMAAAWRRLGVDARVLWPGEAIEQLVASDVALVRLDVLPTLDGVEPGLELVPVLEERGVRVLNRPPALLATHDKLMTAERLVSAGVPHPRTDHVETADVIRTLGLPCVVKPRFGSWGQDVVLCRTRDDLDRELASLAGRRWFELHGALVQEVIGPVHSDLRLVVADAMVIAAAERHGAPGEWRTNVSLGGQIAAASVPQGARELAVRAAAATGIDLAGVDLLPTHGDWTVLELNGAVDFDRRYTLDGVDPYVAILDALDIGRSAPGPLDLDKEAVMTKTVQGKPPRAGDEIVITGHSVGDAPRTALILEVLGDPGHERYRVRWEDGHESIFFPADDAVVRRPERRKAGTA